MDLTNIPYRLSITADSYQWAGTFASVIIDQRELGSDYIVSKKLENGFFWFPFFDSSGRESVAGFLNEALVKLLKISCPIREVFDYDFLYVPVLIIVLKNWFFSPKLYIKFIKVFEKFAEFWKLRVLWRVCMMGNHSSQLSPTCKVLFDMESFSVSCVFYWCNKIDRPLVLSFQDWHVFIVFIKFRLYFSSHPIAKIYQYSNFSFLCVSALLQ